MAGIMDTMKRGYKAIMADPGRITANIRSQAGKTGAAAKKAAKSAGKIATRGTGLGPARGLRDVLIEAKNKVSKY